MIEQRTEHTALPESCSEYEVACGAQASDKLLENAMHLFFYVTKSGVIRTITGISKDLKAIQNDPVCEKDPVHVTGKLHPENGPWRFPPSQALNGISLDAMMPWLWGDFKAFLQGCGQSADIVKRVDGLGGNVEYHIRFSRVISADGGTAGAIISVMAQSEIGRAATERQKLDLLEETFRQVRIFCHDFSQPLMVLSGYLEILNSTQSGDKKYLRDSQLDGLEREIQRLGNIYQKLRDAVIHCRKQIDLTDPPTTS